MIILYSNFEFLAPKVFCPVGNPSGQVSFCSSALPHFARLWCKTFPENSHFFLSVEKDLWSLMLYSTSHVDSLQFKVQNVDQAKIYIKIFFIRCPCHS